MKKQIKKKIFLNFYLLLFFFPFLLIGSGCNVSDNFNWSLSEINHFIKENYSLFANNMNFKKELFNNLNKYEYFSLDDNSNFANKFCNPSNTLSIKRIDYLGTYTNTGDADKDNYFKVLVIYKNITVGGDITIISYIDQQTGDISIDRTSLYDFSSFFNFPRSSSGFKSPDTFIPINDFVNNKLAQKMVQEEYNGASLEKFDGENIKFYSFINQDFDFSNSKGSPSSGEEGAIVIHKMNLNLEFSINFSWNGIQYTAQFITTVNINDYGPVVYTFDDKHQLIIAKMNVWPI